MISNLGHAIPSGNYNTFNHDNNSNNNDDNDDNNIKKNQLSMNHNLQVLTAKIIMLDNNVTSKSKMIAHERLNIHYTSNNYTNDDLNTYLIARQLHNLSTILLNQLTKYSMIHSDAIITPSINKFNMKSIDYEIFKSRLEVLPCITSNRDMRLVIILNDQLQLVLDMQPQNNNKNIIRKKEIKNNIPSIYNDISAALQIALLNTSKTLLQIKKNRDIQNYYDRIVINDSNNYNIFETKTHCSYYYLDNDIFTKRAYGFLKNGSTTTTNNYNNNILSVLRLKLVEQLMIGVVKDVWYSIGNNDVHGDGFEGTGYNCKIISTTTSIILRLIKNENIIEIGQVIVDGSHGLYKFYYPNNENIMSSTTFNNNLINIFRSSGVTALLLSIGFKRILGNKIFQKFGNNSDKIIVDLNECNNSTGNIIKSTIKGVTSLRSYL